MSDPGRLSEAMHQFSNDMQAKKEYSRKLLEDLNFQPSDKMQQVFDLVATIQEKQRELFGLGVALDKDVANRLIQELPSDIEKLEAMIK